MRCLDITPILLTSSIRNVWRAVRRICIFVPGLKGLTSTFKQAFHTFSTIFYVRHVSVYFCSISKSDHSPVGHLSFYCQKIAGAPIKKGSTCVHKILETSHPGDQNRITFSLNVNFWFQRGPFVFVYAKWLQVKKLYHETLERLAWENSRRLQGHHLSPCKMTSEQRAQKFHTDGVSIPRSR